VRIELISESTWTEIDLNGQEQAALEEAGIRLAKGTDRFGQIIEDSTSSVLQVGALTGGVRR
jgi:hypothetical protein